MFSVEDVGKFPTPQDFWGTHQRSGFKLLEDAAVSTGSDDALEESSETCELLLVVCD